MKVTHHVNSWFQVEFENSKHILWTDPWNSGANINGIFPIYKIEKHNLISPDFVYISHIHDDHHDKDIITGLSKDTQYIIKRFEDNILKKILLNYGISNDNLIILDEWEVFSIDDSVEIMIIPQIQSNQDALPSEIDYDMDTAIFIKNGEECFFNQVDMVINNTILGDLISKAKSILGFNKINLYCRTFGAGSEYPQCFINIDRQQEAINLKNRIMNDFYSSSEIVLSDIVIPAGAAYQLGREKKNLENYIAVPTNDELIKHWQEKAKNMSKPLLALTEGGGSIELSKEINSKNSYINLGGKYNRFILPKSIPMKADLTKGDVVKLFKTSSKDLHDYLKRLKHETASLTIYLVEDINKIEELNNKDIKTTNKDFYKFHLNFSVKTSNLLGIYFEPTHYFNWINGNYNFNNLSCGSHLLFEREGIFDWALYTALCRYRRRDKIDSWISN